MSSRAASPETKHTVSLVRRPWPHARPDAASSLRRLDADGEDHLLARVGGALQRAPVARAQDRAATPALVEALLALVRPPREDGRHS